jgi:hypothetical protein
VVEVEDQDRALKFWTETMDFELASMFQDQEGNRFALHHARRRELPTDGIRDLPIWS